jgi:RNA polymerase sigma factor (sigma-70 family)
MAKQQLAEFLDRLQGTAPSEDRAALTDAELLNQFIARRDEIAFEALVRRHGPMVLGVCRRILRNEADAEDAFQTTFLVLAREAVGIRPPGMVGNWLYGVAHNTALKAKAMRVRRRKKEQEASARLKQAPAEISEELLAMLEQELAALPEKYRAPLVLCELEGKTIRETARQLQWPQGTVATRLARGRTRLARRLALCAPALVDAVLAQARESASADVAARLVVTTVQAATLGAAGQAAGTVAVPSRLAALTQGMVRFMRPTKVRVLTMVLLGVTLLAGSAVLLTRPTPAAGQQDPMPAAAANDEKPKSDRDLLQGTWVEESRGAGDGQKVDEEKRWKLVFEDDNVTWLVGSKEQKGTFSLDLDQKPKEIDLSLADPTLVLTGIYELKDNTLKTLWRENDRGGLPKTFDAKKGVLIVFKKEKR